MTMFWPPTNLFYLVRKTSLKMCFVLTNETSSKLSQMINILTIEVLKTKQQRSSFYFKHFVLFYYVWMRGRVRFELFVDWNHSIYRDIVSLCLPTNIYNKSILNICVYWFDNLREVNTAISRKLQASALIQNRNLCLLKFVWFFYAWQCDYYDSQTFKVQEIMGYVK